MELLTQALAGGISARHLLFDSWVAFPVTIRKLLEHETHTLGMLKATEKIFYDY